MGTSASKTIYQEPRTQNGTVFLFHLEKAGKRYKAVYSPTGFSAVGDGGSIAIAMADLVNDCIDRSSKETYENLYEADLDRITAQLVAMGHLKYPKVHFEEVNAQGTGYNFRVQQIALRKYKATYVFQTMHFDAVGSSVPSAVVKLVDRISEALKAGTGPETFPIERYLEAMNEIGVMKIGVNKRRKDRILYRGTEKAAPYSFIIKRVNRETVVISYFAKQPDLEFVGTGANLDAAFSDLTSKLSGIRSQHSWGTTHQPRFDKLLQALALEKNPELRLK